MNRINHAFEKPGAFIGFLTGGDPDKQTTINCIKALIDAGTDLIEIGVPFSDPCAEGPVIEKADVRALENGMDLEGIFSIIEEIRKNNQNIPIVLLTYYNPVFKYGEDGFLKRLKEVGGDGLIIPDMPYEESEEMRKLTKENNLSLILLVSPTSNERIKTIAEAGDGFIYVVSSMGTTGVRSKITTDIPSMIKKIKDVTNVPAAVGFGISTPEQAEKMCETADGAIVGSAIVKIIEENGKESPELVYNYAKQMKEAALKGGLKRQ